MTAAVAAADAVTDALATARLARLVTADDITEPLRERIIRAAYRSRPPVTITTDGATVTIAAGDGGTDWVTVADLDEDPPAVVTLLRCRWCVSVWLGFGVVVARRVAPRAWGPVARALAFSQVAGVVAALER